MSTGRVGQSREAIRESIQRLLEEKEGEVAMFQSTLGLAAERRVAPSEGAELQVEERATVAARKGVARTAIHRSTFRVSAPAVDAQALGMAVQQKAQTQASDDPKGRPSPASEI